MKDDPSYALYSFLNTNTRCSINVKKVQKYCSSLRIETDAYDYILCALKNNCRKNVIMMLIDYGIINNTIIHNCFLYDRIDIIRELVKIKYISINNRDALGRSALHIAVICNNIDGIKLLINAGGDVNIVDNQGNDILELAVKTNRAEITRYLTSLKNIKPLIVGKTPILLAKSCEIIELLCGAGADINVCDNMGNTILHKLIKYNKPTIIECLLIRGINPLIENNRGKMAIHMVKNTEIKDLICAKSKQIHTQYSHIISSLLQKTRNEPMLSPFIARYLF